MAYKAIVKSACRSDWEAGNTTLEEIAKNRGVSLRTLENWSQNKQGQWKKGALAPAIQKEIQEKTIDRFARLGLTSDDAVKKLVECVERAKYPFKTESGVVSVQDWQNILKALEQYHKLIDAYPAQRIEVDIKSIQIKFIDVLLEIRAALPADRVEYFKAKIEEVLR